MRVLVCDDRDDEAKETEVRTKAGLEGKHPVTVLKTEKLTEELSKFFEKIDSRLNKSPVSESKTIFDDYDVVIIDNNLSHLKIKGARLTAEAIAGFVRAFANCAYVVSINKNLNLDFDLRYLIGDYQTKADVALDAKHLESPDLWFGRAEAAPDKFLPWYWPRLSDAAPRRRRQIEFARKRLGAPILATFEFPDSSVAHISRHSAGTLSPTVPSGSTTDRLSALTFHSFFLESTVSLPSKEEREALDFNKDDDAICAIVAGELDRWFRRDILGPQDILVDVPHLISRVPFLLGRNAEELAAWNGAITESEPPFGMASDLYENLLAAHRFKYEDWTGRPCFWWHSIRDDDRINELIFDSDVKAGDFVFCEDVSAFLPEAGYGGLVPLEFTAEFEGPWAQRYVSREGEGYMPKSRLAI